MSLLNSKINNIEAEILDISGGKANTLFPTFQGTATFTGPVVLSDAVTFGSSNITGLTNATVGLGNVQNIDAKAYTDQQIQTLTPATVGLGNVKNIDAKAYTDQQIQTLTQGAPALLNTITELATAINNEPNYYTDINNRFSTLNGLINASATNETNLNANAALHIGAAAGNYTDIALMRTVNINFYPPVLANAGALVYESLHVLPAPGAGLSLFRVDATPSPQIAFNAPVLGNNGFIYNKSEVDNLLTSYSQQYYNTVAIDNNIYTKAQIDATFTNYFTKAQIINTTALANYYTKTVVDSTFTNYFTKDQIINTTALANYYTKTTVDSYIDAKIDATYVLEMMYNAGGHQYLIAVDPITNTTDLNIINKQNGQLIATFDINGSRFNTPILGYSMTLLNPLTGNATAIFNATLISYYASVIINKSLTLLDSTQTHTTAIFNDANITFNLPVVCSSTLVATNIYTKTDIDTKLSTNYYAISDITGLY